MAKKNKDKNTASPDPSITGGEIDQDRIPPAMGGLKGGEQNLVDESDEYLAGWKRALADYENLKRDLDKVKEENRNHIRIDLALQLLPIMDNFEQAVGHVPDLEGCDPELRKKLDTWLQGVTFIKNQFETTMTELGIEKIEVNGEFDPNLHEIVEEGDEIKELSTGWKMGDRILRPAKIINKI